MVGFCKIKAAHKGAGFRMKSTGKLVAFEGTLMFHISDGKVVETWNGFDFLKMFQQMGVLRMGGGVKVTRVFKTSEQRSMVFS